MLSTKVAVSRKRNTRDKWLTLIQNGSKKKQNAHLRLLLPETNKVTKEWSSLDVEKFADEVFKSDSRIRYVAIVDNQLHVLVSRMRDGVQSLTSDDADRYYMQVGPNILIDVAEKLSPALGQVESVTIRYEKLFMVFFRLENFTIVLSFQPTIVRPFMSALSESMQALASRYLK